VKDQLVCKEGDSSKELMNAVVFGLAVDEMTEHSTNKK
jgi:hypothetical protein